jgi:predicted DNA-binding protein (MmcQ/YjbR family)
MSHIAPKSRLKPLPQKRQRVRARPALPEAALKKLRAICAKLPGTVETVTWGHPTFKTGKKAFVVLEPYKGEFAIAFKASLADQAALTMQPRFYVTPYSGKFGWTSLRLTGQLDWDEIRALVERAYRLTAPKRTLRALDAEKLRSRD